MSFDKAVGMERRVIWLQAELGDHKFDPENYSASEIAGATSLALVINTCIPMSYPTREEQLVEHTSDCNSFSLSMTLSPGPQNRYHVASNFKPFRIQHVCRCRFEADADASRMVMRVKREAVFGQ